MEIHRKLFGSLAAVFILFLLIGVHAVELQASQVKVFSDSFDNGHTNYWDLPSGWATANIGGDWFLHATSQGKATLFNPLVYSSYRLRTDVRLGSGSASILYRRSFDDSGYRLELSTSGLSLYRMDKEVSETYLAGETTPISVDAWHTIEISGTLGRLQVSVDNSLRIAFTDAQPWYAGSIGLLADGNSVMVDFDNLEIWIPESHQPPWVQSNGPYGGFFVTIEMNPTQPNILYAAGVGGRVYKTVDAGASWIGLSQIASLNPNTRIVDLLISQVNPQIVYALVDFNTLYRSTDAGSSWSKLSGLSQTRCGAISRQDASILLAGTQDGKVFLTTNGGDAWTNISGNLPITHTLTSLAIISSSEFWAGTTTPKGGGLYHTVDTGTTWDKVDAGEPSGTSVKRIFDDPDDALKIYAGFYHPMEKAPAAGEKRLFKTEDGGTTWSAITLPVEPGGPRIIGKAPDGVLYLSNRGALLKSDVNGQNWTPVFILQKILDPLDIAIDPTGQVLYLPRQFNGLLKSTNAGSDWVEIDSGLDAGYVGLLAAPDVPGSPLVYSEGYVSQDQGNSWETFLDHGIDNPFMDEITIRPSKPEEVWAVNTVGDVYTSTNTAQNWTNIISQNEAGRGFRFGSVYALAPSPSNAQRLYAVRNGMGIFTSTDGGGVWRFKYDSLVDYTYSLAVHPTDPQTLYSGYTPKPFQDWAMVRKTIDGGDTWTTTLSVTHSAGITALAIDPNSPATVYAGSTGLSEKGGGAIYQTTNAGADWMKLNPHFTMLTVWGQPQLILDPGNPSVAYAATWLGGTWRTIDAGASWSLMFQAPTSSTALSMRPGAPNTIFAADRTRPWLWKTSDGGATWTEFASFSGDGAFLVNRVLADGGDRLYIATFGPGLHGGKLYKITGSGSPVDITGSLPRSVLDLAVDPTNPQIAYATTHIHGAYQTLDGGATWVEMTHYPNIGGYDIEVDPANPNILYTAGMGAATVPDWVMPGGYTLSDQSGVYKSWDAGLTWTRILTTTNECRAIRIYPAHPNLLFAAALEDGLQVSNDGGAHWTSYNSGLDTRNLTSVAVAGDKIYAGTQGMGVYAGDVDPGTGAVTWQAARSNKPIPNVYSLRILVDPEDSQRIYVSSNPGGLFRSDDGGVTWYDKNFLTPSVVVDDPVRQGYYSFALNPGNTEEVWLGTYGKGIYKSYDGMDFDMAANGDNQAMVNKHINSVLIHPAYGVLAATEEGVYLTTDGGHTWMDYSAGLDTPQVRTLAVTADGVLLAGTAGYELYSRTSSLTAWTQLNAFSDWGKIWPIWNNRPNYQFTSLLFHPTDRNTIYFGTFPAGIFKSTDGGKRWLESNVGWTFDGVFSMVFHPKNPNTLYVGTYNGLNQSTDAAAHWTKLDAGWPAEQWVFSIAFDPRNPDVMVACSKNGQNMGNGVFGFHGTVMKTLDGGASWFPITRGLNIDQEFYEIIIDKQRPDTLYLATQYEGVFISRDGGGLWLPWNEGMFNTFSVVNNNVSSPMAISANGSYLYFGSAGSGIFRRTIERSFPLYLPFVTR